MDGRFLLSSLNEKAAVSTNSGSYNTQKKLTEQSIIIGTEGMFNFAYPENTKHTLKPLYLGI